MGRREKIVLKRFIALVMLLFSDLLALGICFGLGYYFRAIVFVDYMHLFDPMLHSFEIYAVMWPALGLWVVMFAYEGLYPSVGMSFWEELKNLLKGDFIAFIMMILYTFIMRTSVEFSRLVIVMAFGFSLFILPLTRRWMRTLLGRLGLWAKTVILVGNPEPIRQVLENLGCNPDFGLRPVGMFVSSEPPAQGGQERQLPDKMKDIEIMGTLSMVGDTGHRAEEVIIAMPDLSRKDLVYMVERAGRIAPVVKVLPDLYGLASAGVRTHDLDGMLLLEIEDRLALKRNIYTKRAFDVICSLTGLILLSPFFVIVAMLVRMGSKGPVFFGHTRIGRKGDRFRCYKFRTMVFNAQEVLDDLLASDPDARAEWESAFKLRDDPRITGMGTLLRKTSLDEIPQLFNVLKGEMSLVGPRPIVADEVERYGDKSRYFFKVTPGITGLWQVSGRNDIGYDERVLIDEYYAKNWSFWLDIEIIIRTFGAVLKKEGAY
ncbi:MAG: undecaprenyl-phosphate galactose phosphotransferase WbaP [Thermodesulfobacteriota bacterium]|nr:undecaprenyl-phosphate galactose phosphotransferase WbaP [Thermodesulfobacteriota bacterium]